MSHYVNYVIVIPTPAAGIFTQLPWVTFKTISKNLPKWLLNSLLHKTCNCSKMASPVRRFRSVENPISCYFYVNSCTVCKMKNEEPLIAKSNLVLGLCRASDLIPKRDTWTRRGMHKASVCNSKEQLVFFKTCKERLYVKHCVLQSSFLKFKVLHIPDYMLSSQCQLLVATYCIVHFFFHDHLPLIGPLGLPMYIST